MKNKYEPIAMFNYSNNKYCIILINDIIHFVKYKNKKITMELSNSELELSIKVYNTIKICKDNLITLGRQHLYGKEYEIYYDYKNKLHCWHRIINNKICPTSIEDNCRLNLKYNNINLVRNYDDVEIFDWKEEERKEEERKKAEKLKKELQRKQIRRIITVGGKTLIITVFAGVNLLNLSNKSIPQKFKDKTVDNKQSQDIELKSAKQEDAEVQKYKNRAYDYEKIKSAIDSNSNLSDSEKNFISKIKFYFDENYQYMDIDKIIERLSSLKIKYVEGECENTEIKGTYSIENNIITMYNAKCFDEVDLSVYTHELLHVLQMSNSDRLTVELTNELASREILRRLDEQGLIENSSIFENGLGKHSNYGTGYDPCMKVEYLLASLLTQEQIKLYQCLTDEDVIVDALMEIDSKCDTQEANVEKRINAVNLLDKIDSLREYNDKGEAKIAYTEEKYKEIYDMIDSYYMKKYNKSIEESFSVGIENFDSRYIGYRSFSDVECNATFITLVNQVDYERRKCIPIYA